MEDMHTLGVSYALLEWRYGKQQQAPVAGVAIFSSGECMLVVFLALSSQNEDTVNK